MAPGMVCGITELYSTDPAEQTVGLYLRLSYESY